MDYKIEYDPFHIGSKIVYYADKLSLASKIQNHFMNKEDSKYELKEGLISSEKIFAPITTILTNDVDRVIIQLSLTASALNVIGNDPKNVYDSFKELIEELPKIGFDLSSTFSFYEIITTVILTFEKINPINLFKKFTPERFTSISNVSDITINHIRFTNKYSLDEKGERFQLEISPNLTNPKKSIILRILNRKEKHEELTSFYENLENLIEDVYQKLIEGV